MMLRRFAVFFGIVLLSAGTARGEMMVVESVEWKACKAPVVLRGKVTDMAVVLEGGLTQRFWVEVAEVIKGDVGEKIQVRMGWVDKEKLDGLESVLLFLKPAGKVGAGYLAETPEDVINLATPGKVYSSKMAKLVDGEAIMKSVKEAVASGVEKSIWTDVPWGSPIFKDLWAGSGVSMIVPALPEYRGRYLKMARSENAGERAGGAAELRKFEKDDEVVALLRKLLEDGTENFYYRNADRYAEVDYSVRRAAYESLKELGEDVPEMVLGRAVTKGEQKALRSRYWTKMFSDGLPAGWRVIAAGDGELPKGFRLAEGVVAGAGDVVKVEASDGRRAFGLILISKEMRFDGIPADVDGMEYWGINGKNSQGARHFFGTKGAPKEVIDALRKYIPLEGDRF